MRIVFMGTPLFAVASLEALSKIGQVVGVFTRPDAASGRGRDLRPSPVKASALRQGIPVLQPPSLRDDTALESLEALRPDLLVIAAYGMILPRHILDAAPLGAINVHASLLPRWRGAAPVQRAILAGDRRTGVSIMRMEEGLDTGPYCLQVETPIGDLDASELTGRLAILGGEALLACLGAIADGSASWTPQDDTRAAYAEKITKADVAIRPALTVVEAGRRVRASTDAAPCRIVLGGKSVALVRVSVDVPNADAPLPGSVAVIKAGILLGLQQGTLLVTRLKPGGKSEMSAADWSRGTRDLDGSTWDGTQ